jgi:hypothetical protein
VHEKKGVASLSNHSIAIVGSAASGRDFDIPDFVDSLQGGEQHRRSTSLQECRRVVAELVVRLIRTATTQIASYRSFGEIDRPFLTSRRNQLQTPRR